MPVPKKKTSKSRRNRRRAHDKLAPKHAVRSCPQCNEPSAMHRVCNACGFYQGKEVVHIPIE